MSVSGPDPQKVSQLLRQAAQVARDYYALTGRPLGITGELAEFEAAALLGLTLAPPRQPGYDATRFVDGNIQTVQIKSKWIPPGRPEAVQVLGAISFKHPWDVVVMILLDGSYRPTKIFEADRATIRDQLDGKLTKAHGRGVSIRR